MSNPHVDNDDVDTDVNAGHMPAHDELMNADGSLILTKMPSKMQSWYLQEANSEDDYYGTVQL